MKRPNNGGSPPAEVVEGRPSPKGNVGQTAAVRTLGRGTASNGLARVRQMARARKDARFTALLHHITVELLEQSYFALNRKAVPGTDGMTWRAYGEDLEENLAALHERIHRGSYRAQPARRTTVAKGDGTERSLSILCLEDKIVQQAVVYCWKQSTRKTSWGFRMDSGRGAARTMRWTRCMRGCIEDE